MAPKTGLALYLASRRFRSRARAAEELASQRAVGSEDPARGEERLGQSQIARPQGVVVWLHAGNEGEALGFPELIERMREERDDLSFLVTTSQHDPEHPLEARLPRDVICQYAPYDYAASCEAFLTHWQPDVCLWAENQLLPNLIEQTARADVPMVLLDARVPERPGWRWMPGMRRALLKHFTYVLAGDESARAGLEGLGVPADHLEAVGFLQEGAGPLPCSQAERDMIAEELSARPVWLAAKVTPDEIAIVEAVHQRVMRRAHRLLLVLMPDDPETGSDLADSLERDGWIVGRRSLEDEIEAETEIYVIDEPDELGLWYRLSPVSFLGGSLSDGRTLNPFEAAALGSAVLYGPEVGPWRESFERLHDVGAAREVSDQAGLERAVEALLAPDKVAKMAAAAWEVTTNGAEATDRVVEVALTLLDERGK